MSFKENSFGCNDFDSSENDLKKQLRSLTMRISLGHCFQNSLNCFELYYLFCEIFLMLTVRSVSTRDLIQFSVKSQTGFRGPIIVWLIKGMRQIRFPDGPDCGLIYYLPPSRYFLIFRGETMKLLDEHEQCIQVMMYWGLPAYASDLHGYACALHAMANLDCAL